MKITLILMLTLSGLAVAQDGSSPINENPVQLSAHFKDKEAKAGGENELIIDMNVARNHHAYRDMISVQWTSLEKVTLTNLKISPTHAFNDPFSHGTRDAVEGRGTISLIAHFPTNLSPGAAQGTISVRYQACSNKYCLFPRSVPLNVAYIGLSADSNLGRSNLSNSVLADVSGFRGALAKGKLWAFLFVFIGGFLTSLTPCIFPMIPITISIIGAEAVQHQKTRAFALSVSYVLGIATTYSLLGILAASTGAFFGAALSNIWVVGFIAIVFFALGLSMLGFYEIQVPSFVRQKLGNRATGTGVPGAFLGGLFAGIVASPCIGPVLVAILTYVAETAQKLFGFTLLFTFAMGMGVLFIVLGTFSGLLRKLPRAGAWMEKTKFVFGITFFAMGFYYLYPVIPRNLFVGLAATGLGLFSSYFGAFAPAKKNPRSQLAKGFLVTVFLIGVGLAASLVVNLVYLKSPHFPHSAGQMRWKPYASEMNFSTQANHKPIIIDFSADWCVACLELDKYTYSDQSVIQKSKLFDLIKVDATNLTSDIKALQKKYKVVGLPTVIFIDAQGKIRTDLTVTGFIKSEDFLERMSKVL